MHPELARYSRGSQICAREEYQLDEHSRSCSSTAASRARLDRLCNETMTPCASSRRRARSRSDLSQRSFYAPRCSQAPKPGRSAGEVFQSNSVVPLITNNSQGQAIFRPLARFEDVGIHVPRHRRTGGRRAVNAVRAGLSPYRAPLLRHEGEVAGMESSRIGTAMRRCPKSRARLQLEETSASCSTVRWFIRTGKIASPSSTKGGR